MNWYRKARYEGAEKERSIWYHGTQGKNLPKILSEGLLAFPQKRSYENLKGDFMSPSISSIGGVYLTQNLMTARSSASRNKNKTEDSLIVVVEAQPRTFIMDEDKVSSIVHHAIPNHQLALSEYHTSRLYMAQILNSNKEYTQDTKNKYIQSSIKMIKVMFKITPQVEQQLLQLLSDNWMTTLNRQVSYITPSEYRGAFLGNTNPEIQHKLDIYYKQLKQQYKDNWNIIDKEYARYIDSLIPKQPDQSTSEANYAHFMDKLTKLLKNSARPINNLSNHNPTARTEQNIGFSGSNKIICIIAYNDYNKDKPIEIKYGTPPQKLIEDWTSFIGDFKIKK